LLLLVPDAASWGGLWDSCEDPLDREAVLAEVSRWGQRRWRSRLQMEARSVSDLDELEVEALQRRIAKRRVRREKRRSSLIAKRSSAPPSSLELAQARRLWRGWRRRPPPQGWGGFETYADLLTQVFGRDKTEPLHRRRRDMLIDFMPALDRQFETSDDDNRRYFSDLRDLVVFVINLEGP